MKMLNSSLSSEDYVGLLEQGRYAEILEHCYAFIEDKVESYLRRFYQYYQYSEDFFHEVYIHLLTKSLPSEAFLKACQEGNAFKFYLAKSIINSLNTLLSREKNKKQDVMNMESLLPQQDDGKVALDKSSYLEDKAYTAQADSLNLLNTLKEKLAEFLDDFLITFPKIGHKLLLLLKLNGRAKVYKRDLKNCFPDIKNKEVEAFLEMLGDEGTYAQKEDIELYNLVHPYFQKYRKEKGSPKALQRWLNQHITGAKFQKGIIDDLEIRENGQVFRIQDKKMFSDFLYEYFKSQPEEVYIEEIAFEPKKTKVWSRSLAITAKIFSILP